MLRLQTDYTHKWLFFDEIGIISAIFSTKFTLFRYSKGLKIICGVFLREIGNGSWPLYLDSCSDTVIL